MANTRSGKAPAKTLQEQLPELRPGQSVDLLKALHILTRDGKLNQDSRRKLKQVYHLVQFIEPLIAAQHKERGAVTVVDHGAGKSYLGFILYDLVLKALDNGQVIGIETRSELVQSSQTLALQLGFERMAFHALSVEQAMTSDALPHKVDVVTALHACDTATDDAIGFGLKHQASAMVIVPCCQAEMTVTELVGWEHSMKNELILAKRVGAPKAGAQQRIDDILAEMGVPAMASRFAGMAS